MLSTFTAHTPAHHTCLKRLGSFTSLAATPETDEEILVQMIQILLFLTFFDALCQRCPVTSAVTTKRRQSVTCCDISVSVLFSSSTWQSGKNSRPMLVDTTALRSFVIRGYEARSLKPVQGASVVRIFSSSVQGVHACALILDVRHQTRKRHQVPHLSLKWRLCSDVKLSSQHLRPTAVSPLSFSSSRRCLGPSLNLAALSCTIDFCYLGCGLQYCAAEKYL